MAQRCVWCVCGMQQTYRTAACKGVGKGQCARCRGTAPVKGLGHGRCGSMVRGMAR